MFRVFIPLLAFVFALSGFCHVASAWEPELSESGAGVHWENDQVWFFINEQGCEELGSDSFASVRAGFSVWNEELCLPFRFVDSGLTSLTHSDYEEDMVPGSEVLVVWRERSDEWEHSTTAIAMTTLVYEIASGKLVDADIELNGAEFRFVDAGAERRIVNGWDIGNTVAHEVGHVVGLDHADDPEATMYAEARLGETKKRSLSRDDSDGVCGVYGQGGGGGGGGCQATGKGSPAAPALLLLASLLICCVLRKRLPLRAFRAVGLSASRAALRAAPAEQYPTRMCSSDLWGGSWDDFE